MLILFFLLVSAATCAIIASAKGKSVILWAILGFLFPLISFLILIFSSGQSSEAMPAIPSQAAVPATANKAYDQMKWNALTQYDEDIRRAVDEVSPFGEQYVDQLALGYLALNDKSYLPGIVEKIKAAALRNDYEQERVVQVAEFDKYVSRYFETPTGKLAVLRGGQALAEINGQVRKFADSSNFRQTMGKYEDVWTEVTDVLRKAEFIRVFRNHL